MRRILIVEPLYFCFINYRVISSNYTTMTHPYSKALACIWFEKPLSLFRHENLERRAVPHWNRCMKFQLRRIFQAHQIKFIYVRKPTQ